MYFPDLCYMCARLFVYNFLYSLKSWSDSSSENIKNIDIIFELPSDTRSQCGDNQKKDRQSHPTFVTSMSNPPPTANQLKFSISLLIIARVRLDQLQMNSLLKQHLVEIKIYSIQLCWRWNFTIFASDVDSFDRILNDFTNILGGQRSSISNDLYSSINPTY